MNVYKKTNDILHMITLVMCGTILGIAIYLGNAYQIMGNTLPMPFGYGAAVVLSGSMEPELSVNDLIIVKKTESLFSGDIIVFQDRRELIVHRILDIEDDVITTKGDANNVLDNPIDRSNVKGKVICSIPKIGFIVSFLKTPLGIIGIIIISIILAELPHKREKQLAKQEKQKIMKEIEQLKSDIERSKKNGKNDV